MTENLCGYQNLGVGCQCYSPMLVPCDILADEMVKCGLHWFGASNSCNSNLKIGFLQYALCGVAVRVIMQAAGYLKNCLFPHRSAHSLRMLKAALLVMPWLAKMHFMATLLWFPHGEMISP